ncbi:MAG: ArnT family glycosyltransferase [Adhaeribacter sp.]
MSLIHPERPAARKTTLLNLLPANWRQRVPVLLLLGIALFLRLYRLEEYPIAVHQDELSNFYDANALLETGADRWGQSYPVILRAFGDSDYRPPLFAWLCAGTFQVLGYSIFAGRLTAVLLGMASLLLVYLAAGKLGGRLFACLSLLLATFSPWHLNFSRSGIEGAILPAFFVILALYLWIRAREKQFPAPALVLLGLVMGGGTNSYQAGKLIFLLMSLLVMADLYRQAHRPYLSMLLFGFCCLLGAAPQVAALLTMPAGFVSRARETMMPFSFTYYYASQVLRNIFSNLSPDFLFFTFSEFNYETTGRLLPVECGFFYLGLFYWKAALRRASRFPSGFFYLLLLVVILPSALTWKNPHALRASGLIVLLPLVSAAGILYVGRQMARPRQKEIFLAMVVAGVMANSLYFIREYTTSRHYTNQWQQGFLPILGKRLNTLKDRYPRIFLEDMGNQAYIYILHYCQIKPQEFRAMPKVIENRGWDHFRQMGKYHFLSRAEIDRQAAAYPGKSLIVLRNRHPNYRLVDSLAAFDPKMLYFYEGPTGRP